MELLYTNKIAENEIKVLDILIPQYNETDKIIKPLLDSISFQRAVDFNRIGIIIVNDGSNTLLSNSLLQKYPFLIRYYQNIHTGPSGTRNACLDLSQADYIMWCDGDDQFCSILGLKEIFDLINTTYFETCSSDFYQEIMGSNCPTSRYVKISKDTIFVHGKIFNRQFLIDNHLRWNEELQLHEDSYFLFLTLSVAKIKKEIKDPFYLWCERLGSLSRSFEDWSFMIATYDQAIKGSTALIEELLNRNLINHAAYYFGMIMYQAYYLLTGKYSTELKWQDNINKYTRLMVNYYHQYHFLWTCLSEEGKNRLNAGAIGYATDCQWYRPTGTIDEWIIFLTSQYQGEEDGITLYK